MAWDDKLQKGSFRGVPFFVETHSASSGRRAVQHQFPDRDTPFTEDLGRKAENFSFTFHLLGDDYFDQRDRMVSALSQRGPGELIHPYLGAKQVQVAGFSFTEDTNEGRIVRFTVEFLEAGTFKFPSIEEDRAATLLDFSEKALNESKDDFASKFSVLGAPTFIVNEARALVAQVASVIDNATSVIPLATEAASELAFAARQLVADVNDLIAKPAELAERIDSAATLLSSVAESAEASSLAYETMFDFNDDVEPVGETTETRELQQANRDAFNSYTQQLAIVRATEESIDIQFSTDEDAVSQREKLAKNIEKQLETMANDDLFQAFSDLKSSLVENVPDQTEDLAEVVNVFLPETTNSLALTYKLFQDPTKEQEIIDRNMIEHPGFIVGGQTVSVLNG